MAGYTSSPAIQKGNINIVILLHSYLNPFLMLQLFFAIQLSQNSPDAWGKLAGDIGEQMNKISISF